MFQTNKLLKQELEKRVLELSRERYNYERLGRQFDTQNKTYNDLVEALNAMQYGMIDALFVEGGVVETLVASDKSTQEKYVPYLS